MTTFLTYTYDLVLVLACVCGLATLYYSRSPHTALCFMAGLFVSIALLLLFNGIMFASIAYIIVYVGAILVLFLFVILLIDAGGNETHGSSGISFEPIVVTLTLFIFGVYYFVSKELSSPLLTTEYYNSHVVPLYNHTIVSPDVSITNFTQLQALALELYTVHAASLMIAGMILLFSMVAVIILSKRH